MKNKKHIGKYILFTVLATVICTGTLLWINKDNVFGKYEASEPYITEAPVSADVIVTSEGSTEMWEEGSGVTPCDPKVPTATGKKGSKTNPFVILEVVPDKAMQQLTYLSGNKESGMPFDMMQIGIEMSERHNRKYDSTMVDKPIDEGTFREVNDVYGNWFSVFNYSGYVIGSETEKETMPFATITRYYNFSFNEEDIAAYPDFNADYEANKDDISVLIEKYPDLFQKDDDGNKVRDIAKEDSRNWTLSSDSVVTKEEEKETWSKNGYLVAVEPGKGDFGYATEEDCKNHILTKTGTEKDRWIYCATKEEIPEGYYRGIYDQSFAEKGTGEYVNWEKVTNANGTWHGDELWKYSDSELLTGIYQDLSSNNYIVWTYVIAPEERDYTYTFEYYGMKSNEILKRSLFSFTNKENNFNSAQEEFDNFHIKVICMTPAELNVMSKKDTDSTLDMIERADMYSFQTFTTGSTSVNDTKSLITFYHEKVLGETDFEYNLDDVTTYYENDLEWDLVSKIVRRQSENINLPIIFNQMIGQMLEEGIKRDGSSVTHMYVTQGKKDENDAFDPQSVKTDVHETGSINNVSKLYLIALQFDLLSRKEEDELSSTFMEDIFPYIQKVKLTPQEGAVENTATETGYYDRRLCTCTLEENTADISFDINDSEEVMAEKQEELLNIQKRSCYLWNLYTFFPVDMDVNINDVASAKEEFVNRGFLPTFFDTNANPFRDDYSAPHQGGSRGDDGHNSTIVYDGANGNHSSILGDKGDAGGIVNDTMDVAYKIMKSKKDKVTEMSVNVLKQKKMYVKLSDDAIMIDYSADVVAKDDKTLFVKVIVRNSNNEDGVIERVNLVNDAEDAIECHIQSSMDANTELIKESVSDSEGKNAYVGYKVDRENSLTFYIPYSLKKWQQGYQTVEIKSKARHFSKKKNKVLKTKSYTRTISITQRPLFNLE